MTREEVVEKRMLTQMSTVRAMKAIRMGLIVTSWTFVVLGFMLAHNA